MALWKPGDRVQHATFGAGTVIEVNDQHTVVHFDADGRRKLASNVVVLTASDQPVRPPMARRSGMTSERTTDVGYENLNQQVVMRDLEGNLPGQKVYVLKCGRCGTQYGVTESDIHLRRCPACMGGPPGLPL